MKNERVYVALPVAAVTRAIFAASIENRPSTAVYLAAPNRIILKFTDENAARLAVGGGRRLAAFFRRGLDGPRQSLTDLPPGLQNQLADFEDLDPNRDRDAIAP